MKQSKNYIGFVNDHSGSMGSIAAAAMKDYNTNILAVKDAATREMLDTVVSVVGVGAPSNYMTERQVVISNPHVLKPKTGWPTNGGTPLYDGIGDMIELLSSLPDANDEHVSFLIMITTDGEEMHSQTKYKNPDILRALIKEMQDTGRWTFVFRVPKGATKQVSHLGVPLGNIQEWDTTSSKGMEVSTAATTVAVNNYMTQRNSGLRSSSSFFVDAQNVNVNKLVDLSQEVKLYQVPDLAVDDGIMISTFILRHRMKYLKGAAFYQLVKTESKVGPEKVILIQERSTGKVYGGQEARDMLGLPKGQNARVTPTQLAGYNIFIQSTSWNRKLPKNTGVLYYEKLGTEFSQEEIDRFMKPAQPKRVAKQPLSAQLPQVSNPKGRNIKSTMPVQKRVVYFASRDDARRSGKKYKDNGANAPKGQRWQQV